MARDLFEEAGISPASSAEPRDLFAEAGIKPTASMGEQVYRSALSALPGGIVLRMMTSGDPTQDAKDAVGGAVRGAGSIGATALAPVDVVTDAMAGKGLTLESNRQRRADMDSALGGLGVNTSSSLFQGGKLGAEVAGTAGAGGLLAKGIRALPLVGQYLAPLSSAVGSGGMTTGMAPTTLIGRAGDMATRVAGGALSGGAQAGLIDPSLAPQGALIGGALPAATTAAGGVGRAVGGVLRGPDVDPTVLANARAAQGAGYVIPPTQVRPTIGNRVLEGTAGKLTTAQNASAKNQEVTNDLVRKALGVQELSPQAIQAARDGANASYSALGGAGQMVADDAYQQALQRIAQRPAQFSKDFPQLVNKDLDEMVQRYAGTSSFDAQSGIEAIKRLREAQRSVAGNPMASAAQKAEGKVQGQIANALEDLIERNLTSTGQTGLLKDYQAARKTLAKLYDVEKALNTTTQNVDARVLARQLGKGRPLTGELRQVAEFGQAFPTAAKMPEKMGSLPQFSPLDLFTMPSLAVGGAAGLGPAGAALGATVPVVRAASRYAALSPLVQRGLAAPPAQIGGLLSSGEPLLLRTAPALLSDR